MPKKIIGLTEKVTVIGPNGMKTFVGRIDTGAIASAIDSKVAADMQLGPLLSTRLVRSTHGTQLRPVIKTRIKVKGKTVLARMTIADREHMKYKVLIGQNVLKELNILVDPTKK